MTTLHQIKMLTRIKAYGKPSNLTDMLTHTDLYTHGDKVIYAGFAFVVVELEIGCAKPYKGISVTRTSRNYPRGWVLNVSEKNTLINLTESVANCSKHDILATYTKFNEFCNNIFKSREESII